MAYICSAVLLYDRHQTDLPEGQRTNRGRRRSHTHINNLFSSPAAPALLLLRPHPHSLETREEGQIFGGVRVDSVGTREASNLATDGRFGSRPRLVTEYA